MYTVRVAIVKGYITLSEFSFKMGFAPCIGDTIITPESDLLKVTRRVISPDNPNYIMLDCSKDEN